MGWISDIFDFNNVGRKIKNFTKWSCWISILLTWIFSFIYFFILIFNGAAVLLWVPLVSATIIPMVIWISSWTIYGFGELVEKACRTETEKQEKIEEPFSFVKFEKLLNVIQDGAGVEGIENAINMFADFYIKKGYEIPAELYSDIENLSIQEKCEKLLKILEIGLGVTGIDKVTDKLTKFYIANGKIDR